MLSNALVLAENHGDDLGYPWFDATTGQLVLSVVTPRGRALIDGAGIILRRTGSGQYRTAPPSSGGSRTTRRSSVRRACPVPS